MGLPSKTQQDAALLKIIPERFLAAVLIYIARSANRVKKPLLHSVQETLALVKSSRARKIHLRLHLEWAVAHMEQATCVSKLLEISERLLTALSLGTYANNTKRKTMTSSTRQRKRHL